jgi:hypothetical protein
MKAGDIVIAPEGCESYLTPGKEYVVIRNYEDIMFSIESDIGVRAYCMRRGCPHLNDGDWLSKDGTKLIVSEGLLINEDYVF